MLLPFRIGAPRQANTRLTGHPSVRVTSPEFLPCHAAHGGSELIFQTEYRALAPATQGGERGVHRVCEDGQGSAVPLERQPGERPGRVRRHGIARETSHRLERPEAAIL